MSQPITARAVVFHPSGALLIMHREKDGAEYYVLPGGHVEPNEVPAQAVVRELQEETTLIVTVAKLLYTGPDDLGNMNYIYLCNYLGGEPQLPPQSAEALIDEATNQAHQPMWIAPEHLIGIPMYPPNLMQLLEEDIVDDFQHNPRSLA